MNNQCFSNEAEETISIKITPFVYVDALKKSANRVRKHPNIDMVISRFLFNVVKQTMIVEN